MKRALVMLSFALSACADPGPAPAVDAARIIDAGRADDAAPQAQDAWRGDDAGPSCGNRIIESGELCDGNCPSSCDDAIVP